MKKKNLENEIGKLFHGTGIKPLTASFFITQGEEGGMELRGTRAMYGNLVSANLLDIGTNVVVSFGIGKGSCQWMVLKTNGEMELVGHRSGMNNVEKLREVGTTVLDSYKNPLALSSFLEALESTEKPVIALKSGAVLALDMAQFPDLKAQFKAPEEDQRERKDDRGQFESERAAWENVENTEGRRTEEGEGRSSSTESGSGCQDGNASGTGSGIGERV